VIPRRETRYAAVNITNAACNRRPNGEPAISSGARALVRARQHRQRNWCVRCSVDQLAHRRFIGHTFGQRDSPNESDLLADTGAKLDRLGLKPRELALDGGFSPGPVNRHLPPTQRTFIAGHQNTGSRRTNRRLAKFRVGCEGRISHLRRRYGLRRSRLKGHDGARTLAGWAVLAYNLDTLAIRAA
jgi:IS5 family transposase